MKSAAGVRRVRRAPALKAPAQLRYTLAMPHHCSVTRPRVAPLGALAALSATLVAAPALHARQRATPIAETYAQSCANCHGERGQGGGAGTPSLLIDTWQDQSLDRRYFDALKNGLPDKGMEAFGDALSDAQLWGLVVHIRELQARAWRDKVGDFPLALTSARSARARPTKPGTPASKVHTSAHASYVVEHVVTGGLNVPWSVDWLPDGTMLIAERPGTLRTWRDGQLSEPIAKTPRVRNRGQGGLMDVAVHPDFAQNGLIYLAYSDEQQRDGRSQGMTRVVRGTIVDNTWTKQQLIWEAKPEHYLAGDLHFGSRLVFEKLAKPDRASSYDLYFPIGERGVMQHAQDLSRPNGKVHRVRDDGRIPDDNPFAQRPGAYASIWSFGHRNPQGLVRDLAGRLWDTEHGPRGGDELNLVTRGANFGWPVVSFGINYNGLAFRQPWPEFVSESERAKLIAPITQPAWVWTPSIAASGLDVVRPGPKGEVFPAWRGDLLAGGLAGETVRRVRVAGTGDATKVVEEEEILHGLGRVRDVAVGPEGAVYVVLNGPDWVVKLVPAPASGGARPAPLINSPAPNAK